MNAHAKFGVKFRFEKDRRNMKKPGIKLVLAIALPVAIAAIVMAVDYRKIEDDRIKAIALIRIGKGKKIDFKPGKIVIRHAYNKAVVYPLETLDRTEPGPDPKAKTVVFKSPWFGFEMDLVLARHPPRSSPTH